MSQRGEEEIWREEDEEGVRARVKEKVIEEVVLNNPLFPHTTNACSPSPSPFNPSLSAHTLPFPSPTHPPPSSNFNRFNNSTSLLCNSYSTPLPPPKDKISQHTSPPSSSCLFSSVLSSNSLRLSPSSGIKR